MRRAHRLTVPAVPPALSRLACAVLVLSLGSTLLAATPVAAHAALDTSDPAANAVLPVAPTTITLTFTEPLETSYSRAELYDQAGNVVAGATSRFVNDPNTMLMDLPAGLANGTYSVLWRTLSNADGHTAQGYFAFTVGTDVDVQPVIPPAGVTTTTGPPEWLRGVARWLALLGLAAVVGVWPVWIFVIRPAISPAWQAGPDLTRRVRTCATVAVCFSLAASLFALVVQARTVAGGEGIGQGLLTTLQETRFGTLWLIRVGLFLIVASVWAGCAWWWPGRRPIATGVALILTAILPLPFSLISHAAAQPEGRASAVAFDALHLLSASLWVGGLFVMVFGFAPTIRELTPVGRRVVLARVIARFSILSLIAWGVMGLTGLYSAWLNVGNLDALRATVYGGSLTLKLLLLVPVLVVAAFNLQIVSRKIRQTDDTTGMRWSRRFVAAIAVEAILVVAVLFVVGRLTGQPPAQEAYATDAGRTRIALSADGQDATLLITPGTAGPNHYRLELGSGHEAHLGAAIAPADTEALLRVQLPSHDTGEKEIKLALASGNAFEGHGSELSIAGDWEIEVLVRRPRSTDWTVTDTVGVGAVGAAAKLPGPPWRFGTAGIGGLLLVVVGIATVVIGLRSGRGPLRKEATAIGAAGLLFGGLLLVQARIAPDSTDRAANATSLDAAAVVRGQSIFTTTCVACHGVGGRGDGLMESGLNPPPADLTASHAQLHRDEDYAYWIKNGISGSAMPAFGDQLSDAQITDVVAYLRDLQKDAVVARDAPRPEDCVITPLTIERLGQIATTPAAARTSLAEGAGEPADPETIAGITATMRQLTACSNARDIMRRLALFSDESLRSTFPAGPSAAFRNLAAVVPTPQPEAAWVALLAVEDARVLPDGRAVARATIDNPTRHTHAVAAPGATPTVDTGGQREIARIVFVRIEDRWMIDELIQ